MTTNFKHFIVTRFNLRRKDGEWKFDKLGNPVLTDQWMKRRMNLFENFCYPSVKNQSSKNYEWLVYIDRRTDQKYVNALEKLANDHGSMSLIKVDSYAEFQEQYSVDILSRTSEEATHIISTRLDNDDMIHEDFVSTIQICFKGQSYLAINFLKVYILDLNKENRLNIDYQFSNHFVSLIEKKEEKGILGCYSKGDRFWNEQGKVTQIVNDIYCAELISEHNILNDFRGFPIIRKTSLQKFGIPFLYGYNSFNVFKQFRKISLRKYLKYKTMIISRSFNLMMLMLFMLAFSNQTKAQAEVDSLNQITKSLVEGLVKLEPDQVMQMEIFLDGESFPVHKMSGERIRGEQLRDILMSRQYIPDFYADGNQMIKLAMLRPLSDEEKKIQKIMVENRYKESEMVGKNAMFFSVKDITGDEYSLEDLKGKIIVNNFWFIGCKPCQMEIPDLNKLVKKYKKEVVFLGFALDDLASLESFKKKRKFLYNIIPNSEEVAKLYGVTNYPTHVIIDQNSKIAFYQSGLGPMLMRDIERSIDDLLKKL